MQPTALPPNQHPVAHLVAAMVSLGVLVEEVARAAGADVRAITKPDFSLPVRHYFALFEWAAKATGDPALGVHMSERLTLSDFQLLGYIIENSPNIGEGIRSYERYHDLFARDCTVKTLLENGQMTIEYHPHFASGLEPAQDIMFTLVSIAVALRGVIGPDWVPAGCSMTISRPNGAAELVRVLRVEPGFKQPVNSISVLESDLDIPIPGADPTLLKILCQQADLIMQQVREEDELVYRLRLLIAARVGDSSFGMEAVACALNMSVRTLHRRLTVMGTSFRELRQGVVHLLARQALLDGKASVTRIAHRLGYSETSAFTRAFTRTAGKAPREFRKRSGAREPFAGASRSRGQEK